MRIALVSTVCTPVRAVGVGSVEGVVHLLARELAAAGHRVTVFGAAGSSVPGCDVVAVAGTYAAGGMPDDYQQCELLNLVQAAQRADQFDVLHAHAYLLGRIVEPLVRTPVVHTLHTQPYQPEAALARTGGPLRLTALSRYQWSAFPDLDPVVVGNGVDPTGFTFRAEPEARLCYLGRFLPDKGPLHAVRVARELGMPLVLAGPENDWFTQVVRPHVDGRTVHYAGTVDGRSRDDLLGGSAALLYPVVRGEPFGLVMVEAMMCGTPVVGTPVGAVPEVVDDGVTGRVAPLGELVPAAVEALALDRARVRQVAVGRFSGARMAAGYAAVYADAVRAALPQRRAEAVLS